MKIKNLPHQLKEQLFEWQKEEIMKRIQEPMVAITRSDSAWSLVDDLLVSTNNIMNISIAGIIASIHEIIPNHYAVWFDVEYGEDYYGSTFQVIIINSADLQSIREEGLDGLILHSLFKEF